MSSPMLVVHGVNNRDRPGFEKIVSDLQNRIGNSWDLIPVYWGDLGGKTEGLFDTLFDIPSAVRSGQVDFDWSKLSTTSDSQVSQQVVRSDEARLDLILKGVDLERGTLAEVRSATQTEAFAQVIREELPKTKALQHIEQSDLLVEIGRMLGAATSQTTDTVSNPFVTRAEGNDDFFGTKSETRGLIDEERKKIQAILQSLDRFAGKILDQILGQVNQNLRRLAGVQFVNFFGDVFAYQGSKEKFHERLHQAINSHAPGWGQEDRPISILAHSLGGVLSFDAAVIGQPPLWVDNFVTFGSQSSFFHVVDSRKTLSTYTPQHPVALPSQIRKWYNLWEPLDFLAFNAERIFILSNEESPRDIPIFSPASRILSEFGITHGVYWESSELLDVLKNLPIPGA